MSGLLNETGICQRVDRWARALHALRELAASAPGSVTLTVTVERSDR